MAAKLLVMTTRFTVGALFLIAFRMPVVPMIAETGVSFSLRGELKVESVKYLDRGGLSSCL